MKPTAALLIGLFALAACQDVDKSYDAIHAPENVLGAPLFSEANRQQDATNRKLMEMAKKDSLFYIKKKAATADTAASVAVPDTGAHTVDTAMAHVSTPSAPLPPKASMHSAAPHPPKGSSSPKQHK